MTVVFEHRFRVGWADVDFNAHMRNAAYLDRASDTRMLYFGSIGLGVDKLLEMRLGPVVKEDRIEYFRELRLLEEFKGTHQVAGLAPDCSRYRLRNEFWKMNGQLACRITTTGGYLHLDARKLVAPPPMVQDLLRAIARTEDFEELPSSLK
jgi:acyl-CoA thioester hydrolase